MKAGIESRGTRLEGRLCRAALYSSLAHPPWRNVPLVSHPCAHVTVNDFLLTKHRPHPAAIPTSYLDTENADPVNIFGTLPAQPGSMSHGD